MEAFANRLAAGIFKNKNITWYFPGTEKKLYLTFDDGPTKKFTWWILRQLEKYDAKATFFCLGENIERFPAQFDAIVKGGHSVGNHSYSHPDGWFVPKKKYVSDVHLAGHFINSNLFRPPYGRLTLLQYLFLKKRYRIVLWDLLIRDYSNRLAPERIVNNIKKDVKNGSVLVFHDSLKAENNLKRVLPEVLGYFSELDYEFSAIPMQTLPGNTA